MSSIRFSRRLAGIEAYRSSVDATPIAASISCRIRGAELGMYGCARARPMPLVLLPGSVGVRR